MGLSVQILVRDDLIYGVPCRHTVGRHQRAHHHSWNGMFGISTRLVVHMYPAKTPVLHC
jgi:hypothetical protein